jgi:hypothetical protein
MPCSSGSTGRQALCASAGKRLNIPSTPIKAWMGATHFLTRGLKRVSTEMSLHVLANNMKRMISIQAYDLCH